MSSNQSSGKEVISLIESTAMRAGTPEISAPAPALDSKALEQSLALRLSQRTDGVVRVAGLQASALTLRGQLEQRWARTQAADAQRTERRVNYLSMEFLMGRTLGNALVALDAMHAMDTVLKEKGMNLADVLESEHDAALGNGGLGRLAACFLDSMASTGVASFGYGLRYQHGMFGRAFGLNSFIWLGLEVAFRSMQVHALGCRHRRSRRRHMTSLCRVATRTGSPR
jgi:hypothetical protein